MRVTRAKAVENKELVLDTAAMLFKQKGFDGIGLSDLMKAAGLTVGGFYKSFESKEDLIAQACERNAKKSLSHWSEHANNPEIENPLKRIAQSYLSGKNRDDLQNTCLFSTLAAEVPRHDDKVKAVFAENIDALMDFLAGLLPDHGQDRRAEAIAMFSQWLGALVLARASAGNPISEEILGVALKSSDMG